MIAHDPAVVAGFPGGRPSGGLPDDATDGDIADVLSAMALALDRRGTPSHELATAAQQLANALGPRRTLLVVDNVWESDHVEPFLVGGERTVRLVTTRRRDVLPPGTRFTSGAGSRFAPDPSAKELEPRPFEPASNVQSAEQQLDAGSLPSNRPR